MDMEGQINPPIQPPESSYDDWYVDSYDRMEEYVKNAIYDIATAIEDYVDELLDDYILEEVPDNVKFEVRRYMCNKIRQLIYKAVS